MSRLFVMEDLRALATRALAGGDYTPAESARVRAVPDTRTIRYYTTLGLLRPPAEMRGRTAYYSETHVLQIVAIKRLQAQDLSLSDIQRRLVGLPNSRLSTIAHLPDGFWDAADKYLAKREQKSRTRTTASGSSAHRPKTDHVTTEHATTDHSEFWLTPAALPQGSPAGRGKQLPVTSVTLHATVELHLPGDVRLQIQFPTASAANPSIDAAALRAAAEPLLKELINQRIVPAK